MIDSVPSWRLPTALGTGGAACSDMGVGGGGRSNGLSMGLMSLIDRAALAD
jgi:hypothetical protein